jgi:hypothetical protein
MTITPLSPSPNPARCQRVIEDAHLGEQSGLIPIEMLVGDFASLELDDTG